MQRRSPKPRRRRPCPTQTGWPYRRARRETLRHTVGRDRATRRALTPDKKRRAARAPKYVTSPWAGTVTHRLASLASRRWNAMIFTPADKRGAGAFDARQRERDRKFADSSLEETVRSELVS